MSSRVSFPKLHAGQRTLNRTLGAWNHGSRHVWRCGRRFGKTTDVECIAANRALHGKRVGWFAPTYKLLTPSYSRVLRYVRPIVANASKVESLIELRSGGGVEFWTLEDEDAGRSRSYDLVIIDEAGLKKKGLEAIFDQAIAPTLVDRNGDAIMTGTPKGKSDESFFYQACHDEKLRSVWHEMHMPTHANPTLNSDALARLESENDPQVYRQEYLAEFVDWSGTAFLSLESLTVDGQPVDPFHQCDAVFATIDSAVKTGKHHDGTAVVFWAVKRHTTGHHAEVLDWDIVQVEGSLLESWLPTVFERLEQFALTCKARNGSLGAWIEDKASGTILLQQAKRRGWAARAIESDLTALGKDERGLSISGYVYRGMVKLTRHAHDKVLTYKGRTKNHLIHQVCGYRLGVDDGEDDLYDAFCYGVSVALGNRQGH